MRLSVAMRLQCLTNPLWQGLERLGWNVPVVDVETRANRRFLTWEIQPIKKGSFYAGHVEIYRLWPSVPGR
jgi:hypothetical protein